jgi:hypothetical protein
VRLFPLLSLACRVRVAVEPDAILPFERLTADCASETDPGTTVTVGEVEVTETALMVPVMLVAEPAVVPVKVAA